MRVIKFLAVSSQPQIDQISLSEQDRLIQEWVDKQPGATVVDTLVIDGHSRSEPDLFTLFEEYAKIGVTAYIKLRSHWLSKPRDFDVLAIYEYSRLCRSRGGIAMIIDCILACGGKIYSLDGTGWVDDTNEEISVAMATMKAPSGIDRLVKMRRAAMNRIAANGLPTTKAPAMSHKVEYDPITRKAVRLILDEAKRPLMDYIYRLVVQEHIAYAKLELELYQRFGITNPNTGRRYAKYTFYGLLYNPNFHGHTGRYYDHKDIGQRWVYDDEVAPPEGVQLYRHTIPPVFEGDQAERLKAELRRREDVVRGRAHTSSAYRFTGLIVCANCRRTLGARPKTRDEHHYVYWSCAGIQPVAMEARCGQRQVREGEIVSYLDVVLRQVLEDGDLNLIYANKSTDERPSLLARLSALNAQMEQDLQAERSARTETLKRRYLELADSAAEQIEIIEARLAELDHLHGVSSSALQAAHHAVEHLRTIGVDAMWRLSPGELNPLLHRIFGRQRLLAKDGKIVGITTYQRFVTRKGK